MDYLLCPYTTSCGHVFCEFCLKEAGLMSHDCPICRRMLTEEAAYPLPLMGSVAEQYVQQSESNESRERYANRKRNVQEWKERRR